MRRDPLLWLTLGGLLVAAVVATLHPHEPFDPARAHEQVGRQVRITLEVDSVRHGAGWSAGIARVIDPSDDTTTVRDGSRPESAFPWVWFRPADPPPEPGDRITGRAQVAADGPSVELMLDGPFSATVHPGPHPVAVRWDDLLERPEQLAGRVLLVRAAPEPVDGWFHGPDPARRCLALDGDPFAAPYRHTDPALDGRLPLRLVRLDDAPGWGCRPVALETREVIG